MDLHPNLATEIAFYPDTSQHKHPPALSAYLRGECGPSQAKSHELCVTPAARELQSVHRDMT